VRPFSIELAAVKTAEIIREQARGGRATVVGLSEGAQVAVQLLAREPDLVEKAVISSALVRPIPWITRMLTPGLLRWTYRLAMAPFKKNETWVRLNMKYSAGVPEQYGAQFRQSFQEMDESGFTNLMLANLRFRLPAGLEKAAAPCLLIVGSKEYEAMKQSARDLAACLPDAKAVQVSLGKGTTLAEEHNWALNAPGMFAETVRAWIEGKALPEGLAAL
jgi:pimeloyl-ACP methyl ester carboxylesterase